VVLPAAFVAGLQFPLLIALYGHGRPDVGRQVGHAYASNTAGAIAGSLAGGFGLMPLLTAPGCWRATITLLALIGVAALLLARRWRPHTFGPPLCIAMVALALLWQTGPTAAWRHGSVGVGRAPASGTPNSFENWARDHRRHAVWEADGVESSVALDDTDGYAFIVNGKVDGNTRADASTQVMAGLMGALVHGQVRRSLVIGLGTGSTAGWLAHVPTMERVDVAELEPAILEVARRSAPVNRDVLHNPRVHITIGDAREIVATTRARYDLIFSEPSNPYRAGIASLFTREFYQAASAHLGDDGLFVQWLQAYNVDAQTIRTIYATMVSVFPEVESWITEESDLLLIAGKRPLVHDVAALRRRITEEPWRTALARVWHADELEGVFARYVVNAELARAIARGEGNKLNTDDRTRVEFGFARGIGFRADRFDVAEIRAAARAHGWDKPRLTNGTIEWTRVPDRMLAMQAADWRGPLSGLGITAPDYLARSRAVDKWEDGQFAEALAAWRSQSQEPSDSISNMVLAESLADAGDATAERFIARLRPTHATEADIFQARLQLRQGQLAAAARTLESAFVRASSDPWFLPDILERGVDLALEVAKRDKGAGERLWQRLQRPFVVSLVGETRTRTVVKIADELDWPRLCQQSLAPLEPHVPFNSEFLVRRLRCYERTGGPHLPAARRDLARHAAHEPIPFDTGL
jgi:spermidine synthase